MLRTYLWVHNFTLIKFCRVVSRFFLEGGQVESFSITEYLYSMFIRREFLLVINNFEKFLALYYRLYCDLVYKI